MRVVTKAPSANRVTVLRRAGRVAPRALGALVVAGAMTSLTGCGFLGADTNQLPTVDPGEAGQETVDQVLEGADMSTCFDVVELYSGLVLLPMTTKSGNEESPVVADARASIQNYQDQLPDAVKADFSEAAQVLKDAGETLQPTEAAQLRRTLDPVATWLDQQCTAVAPSKE